MGTTGRGHVRVRVMELSWNAAPEGAPEGRPNCCWPASRQAFPAETLVVTAGMIFVSFPPAAKLQHSGRCRDMAPERVTARVLILFNQLFHSIYAAASRSLGGPPFNLSDKDVQSPRATSSQCSGLVPFTDRCSSIRSLLLLYYSKADISVHRGTVLHSQILQKWASI